MIRLHATAAALMLAAAALAGRADAQRRGIQDTTLRRPGGGPIVIRGQVPTPQVTTVRPRAEPQFSRQVIYPNLYNHSFWPVLSSGYAAVSVRDIVGGSPADTSSPPAIASAPAVGVPGAQNAPPVPTMRGVTVTATQPATVDEELRAIRQELERRRASLDSILAHNRSRLDSAERNTRQRMTTPPDTTRRPPRGA